MGGGDDKTCEEAMRQRGGGEGGEVARDQAVGMTRLVRRKWEDGMTRVGNDDEEVVGMPGRRWACRARGMLRVEKNRRGI